MSSPGGGGSPGGRRGRVLVLGLPYFGLRLANVLESRGWRARFVHHPGRSPLGWLKVAGALARADVLYLISSRAEKRSPQAILLKAWRRPAVIHWVGTDVLLAAEAKERGQLARSVVRGPHHWCDAPWLADELRDLGIGAEYQPLPVTGLAASATPLPSKFAVLLYLPVDAFDREVFDMETLLRLPHAFPDVHFTLIPSPAMTLPGPLPSNLAALSWVDDMQALYDRIAVYVRLTSHDGTSFMALEALSRGRYVVWTFPMPGCIQASGFEAVAAALRELQDRHQRGELGLNQEGMEFARANYDPGHIADQIDGRLRALMQ